jgi:MATE family multidrug resistance protein
MTCLLRNCYLSSTGQVIGLFTVALSEYGVVWLGTNWDREIQKGIERNAEEAKRRALVERICQEGELTN